RGLKRRGEGDRARDRESRPTRTRGLKPASRHAGSSSIAPRPTRARGLKRLICLVAKKRWSRVAPHAGAWIETRAVLDGLGVPYTSRPPRTRGLKSVVPQREPISRFMPPPGPVVARFDAFRRCASSGGFHPPD